MNIKWNYIYRLLNERPQDLAAKDITYLKEVVTMIESKMFKIHKCIKTYNQFKRSEKL